MANVLTRSVHLIFFFFLSVKLDYLPRISPANGSAELINSDAAPHTDSAASTLGQFQTPLLSSPASIIVIHFPVYWQEPVTQIQDVLLHADSEVASLLLLFFLFFFFFFFLFPCLDVLDFFIITIPL